MTTKIDTGTTIAIVFVELSPNLLFAVVSTSDGIVPPSFAGIVICVFKLVFVGGGVSRSFFYNFIVCHLVNFTQSRWGDTEVENVSNYLMGDYTPTNKHKKT